ncbi:aldolase/citrate lyase family protein [Vibrio neptunius]|uniref:aldolase/citrate lyase family protein n=1 Tax=Vibrio neptunius TaxID=170651 RepID=UPI0023E3D013|nr:aldolase/citrate lyase family protein [Vibrio neptunius]
MLITNDKSMAQYAIDCGVDRIFIDTEINGKVSRQGHLDTLISDHTLADVKKVREVRGNFEILVRINPLHEGTIREVETAIEYGADIIMLPMFHSSHEVQSVSDMIKGRVKFIPLVETQSAIEDIKDIAEIKGVNELHIGLNDLHLDMKLTFMFELLVNGVVEEAAKIIRSKNIPFGIGGIAKLGEGLLPAELILSEHVRLGSSCAILSRSFHNNASSLEELKQSNLPAEIEKIKGRVSELRTGEVSCLDVNRLRLSSVVKEILEKKQ